MRPANAFDPGLTDPVPCLAAPGVAVPRISPMRARHGLGIPVRRVRQ
jgi:hypothetical protein